MVNRRPQIIIILALSFISVNFGQSGVILKNKKNELDIIKSEISTLESQLKQKNAKEMENYDALDNYNHQSFLLNRLINELIKENEQKTIEIGETESNIQQLSSEIKELKRNYANYLIATYKRGPINEWESLFNAKSFEQVILRYKYLQKFSEQRIKDLASLKSKQNELINEKANLENELKDKEQLASQKQSEEDDLNQKRIVRKKILIAIRHDKEFLKSEIAAKKNAEIKIQNIISRLIEEEARRRAEELALLKTKKVIKSPSSQKMSTKSIDNNFNNYNIDLSTSGFGSFSSLKGRLNWPVEQGRIFKEFGENRNEKLNTVTLNYGIDIKTKPDEDVRSVADGVVSAIDWIPGYGSIIIITHKGDYRTVYSHLSNIFVKEGDRVKLGTIIGKVGESLEGNILHFEIWNQRNKQNPEIWLARK